MVIVHRQLRHEGIEGDRPRVIGHDQRATLARDVFYPAHLNSEPLFVERSQCGHQDVVGQIRVVTKFVNGVVTGESASKKIQPLRYCTRLVRR